LHPNSASFLREHGTFQLNALLRALRVR
jgi:hypothetical protein